MNNQEIPDNYKIVDLSNLDLDHILLLNKISVDLIEDFNNLSEIIFKTTNQKMVWLFSSVLSRNLNQSNLFLYCCYLILLDKILLENKNIEQIIVPSGGFKKVLSNYLLSKSFNIIVEDFSNKNCKQKLKDFIWRYFGILYTIHYCWQLFSTAKSSRKIKICNTEGAKLIDTFILENSIKKGIYIDRNYTGLLDFLEEKEKDVLFFVPHVLGRYKKSDLQQIFESSEENIVFKQDFLKLSDYTSSLISILRMGNINKVSIFFREFDISPIVSEEISVKKYSALSGLLNFHFIKRLKQGKVDLGLAVDWFENQQIDKGFNLGVKTHYPNVRHIGYKGYISTETFEFYTNPTPFEVKENLIPDTLGIIGRGYENSCKKYSCKQNIQIVGGFRFNNLWKYQRNYKESMNKKIILVALPIFIKDSVEILRLVIDVVIKNNFDVLFHLKPHPALNFKAIKNVFMNNWPNNFLVVEGDFVQSIVNVNMVLGSGTTSCVEPLALGIPVIIIGSQSNLTINPIPLSINNKIWRLAYTSHELENYIIHYLSLSQPQIEELIVIGHEIKEEYFQQVTDEKVRLFLNLNS